MLIGGGDGLVLHRSSDDGVVLRSTASTRLNDEVLEEASMRRQLGSGRAAAKSALGCSISIVDIIYFGVTTKFGHMIYPSKDGERSARI